MTQRFLLGAALSTQVQENTHSNNRENHQKWRGCVCNTCAAYCAGLVFTRQVKCGFAVLISPLFRQTTPSTGLACSLQHFQSFYKSPCKHRKPPPFQLATYERGLWSCSHSLYNWVHCSESFCQDLQFTIGYIVQSWPRVARQHHLEADTIWNEYLIQQKTSNEVVERLTSVPLSKSSLTKGITPRMMSTPLLSTKNKAHLWGGPWKRKHHRLLNHKQVFHAIFRQGANKQL